MLGQGKGAFSRGGCATVLVKPRKEATNHGFLKPGVVVISQVPFQWGFLFLIQVKYGRIEVDHPGFHSKSKVTKTK